MSNIAIRVGNLSQLRHCPADNAAAVGYAPAAALSAGPARLITDGAGDHPATDRMAARHELAQAGLLR